MAKKDMFRLSHLLAGSSVCLNSGSTLSIDAILCGTPVILTSFDGDATLDYWQSARRLIDYPHLRKLVELGGVSVVKDFIMLADEINSYLADPLRKKVARTATIVQQCGETNGEATECVSGILYSLRNINASLHTVKYGKKTLDFSQN